MNVLVTGAAGFLGRYVVKALVEAGYGVRAQVRSPSALYDPALRDTSKLQAVVADLLTTADLRPLCADVDAVIHLAAAMTGSAQQQLETACTGTRRLIDAMAGASTRVVLASSFAVYDWNRVGAVLNDSSPLLSAADAPLAGGYAAAKAAQERLTRDLCAERRLGLTVLRPATVWAAGRWGLDTVGPRAGGIQWVVSPRRTLHLTYVENCADAFVAALQPSAAGRTAAVEDGHDIAPAPFADRFGGLPCRSVPGWLLQAVQGVGGPFAAAARAGLAVPGLLIPARSRARYPTARVAVGGLPATPDGRPPYGFEQAVARTLALERGQP